MLADRRFARALCIASPSLYSTCQKAISGQPQTPQQVARAHAAASRYLTRMSTRATPFGLCAGVALGYWGDDSSLQLDMEGSRSHTTVAMEQVARLASRVEGDRNVVRQSRLVTNQLVRMVGKRALLPTPPAFRHAGPPTARSVRLTAPVARALEIAQTPLSWHCLVERLRSEWTAVEPETIESLVADLTGNGFLLSDLFPPLTVADPARWLRERLAEVPAAVEPARELAEQIAAAEKVDEQPLASCEGLTLTSALAGESDEPRYRTDLRLAVVGERLNAQIGWEAARVAEWLLRLSRFPQGPSWLSSYRGLFVERYGNERRVPVLELLDPATGLGFPGVDARPASGAPFQHALRRQDRLLLGLATSALWQRQSTVELSDDALEALCVTPRAALQPHESLEIYVSVAASSLAALDRGDFRVVVHTYGGSRSAGKTFGRFAGLFGDAGTRALAEAAEAEAALDPQARWVEIAHLPSTARLMNVCARQVAREGFLLAGAFPPCDDGARTVSMSRLAVGTDGGRLRLYSMDDGRIVRPGITHMLNLVHAADVVRFVCEIESDGAPFFQTFPWGPAASFEYLPRVTHGRWILRCARWRLNVETLGTAFPREEAARSAWLQRWLEEWRVPPSVFLSSGDHRLLLDLTLPEHLEELVRELARLSAGRRSEILLEEVVPSLDELWCTDREGELHVAEIVVPLVAAHAPAPARRRPGPSASPLVLVGDRRKPPGSEWLYFQLPVCQDVEEAMLADGVLALAERAVAADLMELWHFVRYTVPRRHLRVRFRTARERSAGEMIDWLSRSMRDLLGDLQSEASFAVYDREVERYGGGRGMGLVEEIFSADSWFAGRVIRTVAVPEERATIAALAIRQLLQACGLQLPERLEWYRRHGVGGRVGRLPYRDGRRILAGDSDAPRDETLRALLAQRSEQLRTAAGSLRELESSGELSQSLASILSSVAHMSCNRLFGPDAKREQEVRGMALRLEQSLLHVPLATTAS